MVMMMKKKRGEDFEKLTTSKKPVELLELGKKRKREAINRARDEESWEEIKEFLFEENTYEDSTYRRYFG